MVAGHSLSSVYSFNFSVNAFVFISLAPKYLHAAFPTKCVMLSSAKHKPSATVIIILAEKSKMYLHDSFCFILQVFSCYQRDLSADRPQVTDIMSTRC